MNRLLVLLLLVLLALLQLKFWIGDGGWYQAKQLQRTVELQQRDNAKLIQRNEALSAEVQDLKSGEAAVEERARAELGMIKPGEVFYRVVEPAKPGAPAPDVPIDGPAEERFPADAASGPVEGPSEDVPSGDVPPGGMPSSADAPARLPEGRGR